jgi:hypothetical protein
MNPFRAPPKRHDVITIPIVWVAIVLSLLVHVAALWLVVPRLREAQTAAPAGLSVRLTPRADRIASAAAAAPAPQPAPPPPRAVTPPPPPRAVAPPPPRQPRPRRTIPARPAPPIIAHEQPAPRVVPPVPAPEVPPAPSVAPPPVVKPPPVAPGPTQDLAAYVEARRRARGESSTPSPAASTPSAEERDIARRDRIVAENLGLNRTPTFGHDPRNAGGLFQIRELNLDNAEFYFFGFDKDIQRNAKQLIEVRKGNNPDIRIAVVRRMIAIIREKIPGDFLWVSQRLGRQVQLSARPEDNAGLEDFIMRDVFPDARLP